MLSETTPRFGLPLLAAGQAQKEIIHNEALIAIDALVQPVAMSIGDNAPPSGPAAGQSWIIGAAPSGVWAGWADAVATWTPGGWRFAAPQEGMAFWVADAGLTARYVAAGWQLGTVAAGTIRIDGEQVVGPRRPAIADPIGGTSPDTEARAALSAVLTALREHGLIDP